MKRKLSILPTRSYLDHLYRVLRLAICIFALANAGPAAAQENPQVVGASSTSENPTDTENDRANNKIVPSRRVLGPFMQDPTLRQHYRDMLWSILMDPIDLAQSRHHFKNREVFGSGFFEIIKEAHLAELTKLSRQFRGSMIRLNADFPRRYARIFSMAEMAAIDLGFSSAVIGKIEIYQAAGAANAFTVSGTSDRIIIVLNSALVENMTNDQIRTVLLHELGHIRSLHSIKKLVELTFLKFLHTYLLNQNVVPPASALSPSSPAAGTSTIFSDPFGKPEFDLPDPSRSLELSPHTQSMAAMGALGNLDSNSSLNFEEISNAGLQHALNLPSELQKSLALDHLSFILNAAMVGNAESKLVEFFRTLKVKVAADEKFAVNPKALDYTFSSYLNILSRSAERTSDNFAAAHAPNKDFVGAILKLTGMSFNTDEERDKILTQVLKQSFALVNETNGDAMAQIDSGTHPLPILRIRTIHELPSFPHILLANPFLRLVMFEDYLRSMLPADPTLKESLDKLQSDILKQLGSSQNPSGINQPRIANLIQYYSLNKRVVLGIGTGDVEPAVGATLAGHYGSNNTMLLKVRDLLSEKENKLVSMTGGNQRKSDSELSSEDQLVLARDKIKTWKRHISELLSPATTTEQLEKMLDEVTRRSSNPDVAARRVPRYTPGLTTPVVSLMCQTVITKR